MKYKETDPRLEELLAYIHNIDAREVLDELGIEYSERGKNVSEGWLGVNCPFCDDSSDHLGVNINGKSISCFSCGQSGTIIRLVSKHIGYYKALDYLATKIPKELVRFAVDKESINVFSVEIPDNMKFKKSKHWNYLKKRKFNPKKLFQKYNLQCVTEDTEDYEYRNRIFVPIHYRNRLVTFTTISIEDSSYLRYLHCPDKESIIPIKHLLYMEEFNKNKNECIVVEGVFDAWRIGEGAVCVFGTKVTEQQIFLLKKYNRVKLCFDGDRPGKEASNNLASQLSAFTEVIELFLPAGNDPDKLSKKDIAFVKNY